MTHHPWVQEFPAAITVCSSEGTILEMNAEAARVYQENGGMELVGSNILDCHPESARPKVERLLQGRESSIYTFEKNGVKKLVCQLSWHLEGRRAGLIELEFEIPFQMPHQVDDTDDE